MAKPPKFKPINSPRGWRVNIPAKLSDTGVRQQRYYQSRDMAEAEAKRFREDFRENGNRACVLPPRVADDALAAWELLKPHGITFMAAVKEVIARIEREAASVPIETAVSLYFKAKADELRGPTEKSYGHTTAKLIAALPERSMVTITAAEVEAAIAGASFGTHRRNARAFWRWCAKAPRKWCDATIFEEITPEKPAGDGEIEVLAPELVERLIRTAEEHYPETVCMYAVGFWGGVRVEELKKLSEDEFSSEGLAVGAGIAKKKRRRHITASPALAAWLERYPFIPPTNWIEKHKAVRALAGWDVQARILKDKGRQPEVAELGTWPRNVIRHTHASAEISNGATLEDLLFRFGHTDGADMLRSHYVGRYTKKQAEAFFALRPVPAEEEELEGEKVA